MQLDKGQISQYDRDGFLIFPGMISAKEVEILRDETERLRQVDSDLIRRERTGAVRTIFRTHEDNGATRSPPYRALTRLPRILGVARQLLRDDALYIFHTKMNVKPAIEGSMWSWHQDYGTWQKDGIKKPEMLTVLVMLDEADELGGALYFIPGSHRDGTLEHVEDPAVGALNQYTVRRDLLLQKLKAGKALPVDGPAGTVAFFHCNVIHGSGHNMSHRDRRQEYIIFNRVSNKPAPEDRIRGDYLSSENQAPIPFGPEDGILSAASAQVQTTAA